MKQLTKRFNYFLLPAVAALTLCAGAPARADSFSLYFDVPGAYFGYHSGHRYRGYHPYYRHRYGYRVQPWHRQHGRHYWRGNRYYYSPRRHYWHRYHGYRDYRWRR